MDFLKQILADHFTAILYTTIGLVVLAVVLSILLFRELTTHYERTRKAMLRFVQLILGVRLAARGDATADDALAKTMTEPMKAQPDPRKSGEKKP